MYEVLQLPKYRESVRKMMDEQLGRTKFMAGDEFSYGDIPVGIMIYRYTQLIPERPATPNHAAHQRSATSFHFDSALLLRAALLVSAIMSAIADTTMDFIAREPPQAKRYTKAGFDAFWKAAAG